MKRYSLSDVLQIFYDEVKKDYLKNKYKDRPDPEKVNPYDPKAYKRSKKIKK